MDAVLRFLSSRFGRRVVPASTGGGRTFRRDDRGAATVELALIFPILLMVMYGIAEFGIFFTEAVAIANAAHNGARYASVHPTSWSTAASPGANTIEGQVRLAQNSTTVPNDDTHIYINYLIVTGSTATTCGHYSVASAGFVAAGGYSQATCVISGSMIQITVTYTYHFMTPFFQTLFPSGLSFSPSASILEEV